MFGSYSNCPVCGMIHDDGAIYNVKDKTYFVCFDCSDSMTDEEIEKIIERNKVYVENEIL